MKSFEKYKLNVSFFFCRIDYRYEYTLRIPYSSCDITALNECLLNRDIYIYIRQFVLGIKFHKCLYTQRMYK